MILYQIIKRYKEEGTKRMREEREGSY